MNTMKDLFNSVFSKMEIRVHKLDKDIDISKTYNIPIEFIHTNVKVHNSLHYSQTYKKYAPKIKHNIFYTGDYWKYYEAYKKKYSSEKLNIVLGEDKYFEQVMTEISNSNYKYKNKSHIITNCSRYVLNAYIHSNIELNRDRAKIIALSFFEAYIREVIKHEEIKPYMSEEIGNIIRNYDADIFVLGTDDIIYHINIQCDMAYE